MRRNLRRAREEMSETSLSLLQKQVIRPERNSWSARTTHSWRTPAHQSYSWGLESHVSPVPSAFLNGCAHLDQWSNRQTSCHLASRQSPCSRFHRWEALAPAWQLYCCRAEQALPMAKRYAT